MSEEFLEVVLRDLQPLLQSQLGEELIVENYSQKLLLPPGENYGSTILSVIATIKKNQTSESETLNLVAKMLPPTIFQRKTFDSGYTFRKEIFLYTNILPYYKKLEIEFGVDEKETFDIGPRFFGSRLSLKEEVDIDEDAVILLENLKIRGYYTGDRKQGVDLEHARVAVQALAKFHALGMAAKYQHAEQFEILKRHCKCLDFNADIFQEMHNSFMKAMNSDPEITKYKSRWESYVVTDMDNWLKPPEEPWSTIVHSDFWVNNIMFHKNSTGKVDDIKFVDFQNYLFQDPINELIFFICGSVIPDILPKNLESLLHLYYKTFISNLEKFKCDVSPFRRNAFDEKVKISAKKEFYHCAFMFRVVTVDVEKDDVDTTKLHKLEFGTSNAIFYDRMRKLISLFMERDWI